MFLKFGFSAALLLAASPIAPQPQTAPQEAQPADPHQAEIQRMAMAFGQCISTGMENVSASVTPEAGAAAVFGGCAAQRDALAKSVDAAIATLPEDQRATAHTQFESQINQVPAQLAEAIRQHRAAPAPATPSH